MAEYVQAWLVTTDIREEIIYDQQKALDNFEEGTPVNITSLTIIRYRDGSREFLPGTVAEAVKIYRENL